uniref:Uncharacterized protein n=1 Tax=Anopheles dirus TaxID=7168 RepID=A0A182NLD4_9DIPT
MTLQLCTYHNSVGTILQRTTVGIGKIKIQAVATCLFLCMDTCGSVYGSPHSLDPAVNFTYR